MIGKNLMNCKNYCCENLSLIENYNEALTSNEYYECHHRLETHNSDGKRRAVDITRKELKALDMYYNRPSNELIFLKRSEHVALHNENKIRHKWTEEQRENIRGSKNSMYGKTPWNKGKTMDEETRKKVSKSCIGVNKGKQKSEHMKQSLKESLQKCVEAYRKTGRNDWNAFKKEYFSKIDK